MRHTFSISPSLWHLSFKITCPHPRIYRHSQTHTCMYLYENHPPSSTPQETPYLHNSLTCANESNACAWMQSCTCTHLDARQRTWIQRQQTHIRTCQTRATWISLDLYILLRSNEMHRRKHLSPHKGIKTVLIPQRVRIELTHLACRHTNKYKHAYIQRSLTPARRHYFESQPHTLTA